MCTPFSPDLCLKPGLKGSAYIYGRTPSPLSLVFFLDEGVWVCASFVFYSYALEVVVEMCVCARGMLIFLVLAKIRLVCSDSLRPRLVWSPRLHVCVCLFKP
jgi:hypothetical protein